MDEQLVNDKQTTNAYSNNWLKLNAGLIIMTFFFFPDLVVCPIMIIYV